MNIKKTAVITAIAGVVLGASFAAAQVTTTSSCYQFERNLRVGNTGADVKALQQTLNANGFTVAAAGHAGSAGMETTYFGNATKNALIKWQEANAATTLAPWGLTSGTGFFGATSRAEMNKCAPGTPTTPGTGTVSGAVSVSLASVQPNNVLVAESVHAKLADFVFSGTGIVTNVKLAKTGISNNTALTNVYLYDGNTRISDAASVMMDGSINFTYGTGLFSVTGSKTISVYADIAAGTSGQSVGVALTGYTVSGASQALVSGLNGNNLPISSATLAKITIGTVSSQTTADIGNQNVNLWSSQFTADKDVNLRGATFRMIGSAQPSDVANLKLYVDGLQVGNAVAVDANGRVTFSGNALLKSGTRNVRVAGDIVNGAGRYFHLTLEQGSDILFEDSQLAGAYAMPKNGVNPIYNADGKVLTINSCTSGTCVVLSADSNFSGQRVVMGGSNQLIGKFTLSALGEPIKLMNTYVDVKGASTTQSVSSLTISVNGMIVASGINESLATTTATGTYVANLGGMIINPGQVANIEIRADLKSSAGVALIADPNLVVGLNKLTFQGTQSYAVKDASKDSNSVNVGGGTAQFAKNSSMTTVSATPNQSNVKIGSFTLSSGNVEGVTITEIEVSLEEATPGNGFNLNTLTNLLLKRADGTVVGSRGGVGSGTSTTQLFSFYEQIDANKVQTYDLFADFSNATAAMKVDAKATYEGQISGAAGLNSLVGAVTTNFGSATLTYEGTGSNSAAAQAVTGGSSMTTNFLVSSVNPVKVNQVEVLVTNPAAVSSVTIGGVNANGVNGKYSADVNIAVGSGFGTPIPVVVTFNQPSNNNGLSNATTSVKLTYVGTDNAGTKLGTQGSYNAISATTTSKDFTSAIAIVNSVSASSVTGNVANGTSVKIGSIVVNTTGTVKITKIPFTIALPNSGTTTAVALKRAGTTLATSEVSGVYTITNGDIVNGTVTYDVYATIGSMTTAGTPTLSLGAASGFEWNDSANDFAGTLVPKYND